LERISRTIHKYGGDIIQFMGNSLIAVWPRGYLTRFEHESDSQSKRRAEEDSDIIVCRKAAQCALEIKLESQRYS